MIRPVGFLDTWACSSTVFAKYKDRFNGDGLSLLPLRGSEHALPLLAEFRSAKALLSRVRTSAAPFFGRTPDMGEAHIVRLEPGAFVPWSSDEARGPHAHLCLVPAPGAWIYCGGDSAVLPVGQLTLVDHRKLWSAANFGDYPTVHLVAELYVADDQMDDSEPVGG